MTNVSAEDTVNLSAAPTSAGVYCLIDLDGRPAYVGQTGSSIRQRLRQHLIRQTSSVTSSGRLDPWDIAEVRWWQTDSPKRAEQFLLEEVDPYLNTKSERTAGDEQVEVDLDNPDGETELASGDTLDERREPYRRAKRKMDHLDILLGKVAYADQGEHVRKAGHAHRRILEENLEAFLDVVPPEQPLSTGGDRTGGET